jgi:putative membrane protein
MPTTASDHKIVSFRQNKLLQTLVLLFSIIWLIAAIAPENRFDWFLENLLVFLVVGLLAYLSRAYAISDLSYFLIIVFLLFHTMGAHYTYSKTPVGFWLQDFLSLDRNHYDRIIHFCFGLFIIYPIREFLFRYCNVGLLMSGFTAFTTVTTMSVAYETIEWAVAVIISPEAAMAFLGTQGDLFDAQKDSALAITGSIIGLMLSRRLFKPRYSV